MVIFAENDQTAIELEQWSDRSRGSRARPKTPSGSIFLQVSLRLIHFRDHSIIPPLCLLKGHAYLRARGGGGLGAGEERDGDSGDFYFFFQPGQPPHLPWPSPCCHLLYSCTLNTLMWPVIDPTGRVGKASENAFSPDLFPEHGWPCSTRSAR